jgi:2',3'-cyclic-nucleotide 2'-phosphodiesterase (5'-nucleotidase family)
MKRTTSIAVVSLMASACLGFTLGHTSPLDGSVKKLTFLLTNDIHGHLEPSMVKNKSDGGLAYFATLVDQARAQTDEDSALFVLDSGDQFQGTLLSNYDEGRSVFLAMNETGYDAAIPGNHDYDFGPLGWLYDRVVPGQTSNNPREVIEGLSTLAKFPLLSSNTYLKASVKTIRGDSVKLDSQCKPLAASTADALTFAGATRPAFLKPYVIIEKVGVRVALIGIDNHSTASTTTAENVSDLCFRDEVDTYLEIRKELEGKADVFVMLMHNGNAGSSHEANDIAHKINLAYPNGVHLIAAGHTHFIHNDLVDGVRVIQDGAEMKEYGKVSLFYDTEAETVLPDQTVSLAGLPIEDEAITPKASILKIIADLRVKIAPLTEKVVLTAAETIRKDRTNENALGNLLTDALRSATGTDIALMNSGGIRIDLPPGTIHYEKFFEVLPFGNQAVVMKDLKWSTLKKVLTLSAQSCGRIGSLNFSGLRVKYTRTCTPASDMDFKAHLTHVEMLSGEVLFDLDSSVEVPSSRLFNISTIDFLALGGDFADFKEASISESLGIARDVIADELIETKPTIHNQVDGRFLNLKN